MLQNEYFRILKANRNLIVNVFDKPYIAIVFASWHLQVNTGSDLILGLNHVIFYLVLSLVGASIFLHFHPLGK